MRKKHQTPEFQVIKMNEANAKFYAASTPPGGQDPVFAGNSVTTPEAPAGNRTTMGAYNTVATDGWF